MKEVKRENSLAVTHPELAKEWHPTKNGNLTPYDVSAGMNKRVWWQCKHGHEWQALVRNRAVLNRNCPYCSGRYPIVGETDLATTHPEIAKQWHPTLNGDLKPTDVTYGSNKKVWWQCEYGHEWQATVSSRTAMTLGCPYCSNKAVLEGYNDLATTHPEIAKQWHPTLNGDLKPTDVTYGSGKKVWWQCEHGHEWQATVNDTVSNLNSCPYCGGYRIIVGENDLATTHPEIAKQWHPTKNGALTPYGVTYGCNKKVWWQCEHGHEWQSKVSNRAFGRGCPHCSHNGTSNRELVVLDYIKKHTNLNVVHRFSDFGFEIDIYIPSLKTGIEYDGHLYHKDIEKDIFKNEQCKLNGIKLYRIREDKLPKLNGYSKDFYYTYHHEKDFLLILQTIVQEIFDIKTAVAIKYQDNKMHQFIAMNKVSNSLAELYPELAKEWHPTKNGNITPSMIKAKSNLKVWWKCEHGHEWQTKVNNRTSSGKGCPYCSGRYPIVGQNDLATIYPEIAKQWHPTLNGDLKPTDVKPCSGKMVWWINKNGNITQSRVCYKTEYVRQKHKVV